MDFLIGLAAGLAFAIFVALIYTKPDTTWRQVGKVDIPGQIHIDGQTSHDVKLSYLLSQNELGDREVEFSITDATARNIALRHPNYPSSILAWLHGDTDIIPRNQDVSPSQCQEPATVKKLRLVS